MQTVTCPARERVKEILRWCNDDEIRELANTLTPLVVDALASLKLGTANPETTIPRALYRALSVYPHLPE